MKPPEVVPLPAGNPLADKGDPDYVPTVSVMDAAKKPVGKDELERLAGTEPGGNDELGVALKPVRAARKVVLGEMIKCGMDVVAEPDNRLYEDTKKEVAREKLLAKLVSGDKWQQLQAPPLKMIV